MQATVNAHAGTGASASVNGNDRTGVITIVSGSASVAAGAQVATTFAHPQAGDTHILVSAAEANAAGKNWYAESDETGITLSCDSALATGTTYSIAYLVEPIQ